MRKDVIVSSLMLIIDRLSVRYIIRKQEIGNSLLGKEAFLVPWLLRRGK
jgi:hypothetical protein